MVALHWGDVESPVFPRAVADALSTGNKAADAAALRQRYEGAFAQVLTLQGSLSLADIFGGNEVVEEFWDAPDIQIQRRPRDARPGDGPEHLDWTERTLQAGVDFVVEKTWDCTRAE
mmetsp:Transcript_15604/g.41906  ORF Transcript_15604/g.41906 Transcript_15604/m.41906 type:complete len:117 (-) Transcript_15604:109-459(-)